jgi:RsiW-degrading membrane proteinase PrsW (M82 family)
MKFSCPLCGGSIEGEESWIGLEGDCPLCGKKITIPKPDVPKHTHLPQHAAIPVHAPQSPPETASPGPQSATAIPVADHGYSLESSPAFSTRRLVPMLISVLGLGWVMAMFISEDRVYQHWTLFPVLMLATPGLFLAILTAHHFLKPNPFPVKRAVVSMLFTMLVGIVLLLLFQGVAEWSIGEEMHGKTAIIMAILKMVGLAYREVSTDGGGLGGKLFGFIVGVGLCEETTKLLPLFWLLFVGANHEVRKDYRGFLMTGYFSGLGFGIGEALSMYAPWNGNDICASNVLRWFSVVPSHGIWTVICAACLWWLAPRVRAVRIRTVSDVGKKIGLCALAVVAAAVAHGIYNVLCGVPLFAVVMIAATIMLMGWIVRLVATKQGESTEVIPSQKVSGGLPGWLGEIDGRYPKIRYAVTYAVAVMIVLLSLAFSSNRFGGDSQSGGIVKPGETKEFKYTYEGWHSAGPGSSMAVTRHMDVLVSSEILRQNGSSRMKVTIKNKCSEIFILNPEDVFLYNAAGEFSALRAFEGYRNEYFSVEPGDEGTVILSSEYSKRHFPGPPVRVEIKKRVGGKGITPVITLAWPTN